MYRHIVIGSGIAGLYTALLASKHGRVLLLTKDELGESNTRYAQGGIAAPVGADDSPEQHAADTILAGAGLCDPVAVQVLTEEAPARILDLIALGVMFDCSEPASSLSKSGNIPSEKGLLESILLGREAAHQVHRILHAGGDATGAHVERTLRERVLHTPNIDVREHHLAVDLLRSPVRVTGVRAMDLQNGLLYDEPADFIVLATGGAGQLFSHTTNPAGATADGIALAYRAGAALADLEFYQFHPTALQLPGAPPFLISEALRGEGAVLRNRNGHRFMRDIHPLVELAPRDVIARAIWENLPGVTLDARHLGGTFLMQRFPTIYRRCLEYELDITKEPIPIAPAAHYYMGGVWTDLWGETSIPGLFACGEAACTGVHGANRLASNSLVEGLVFAYRSIARTVDPTAEGTAPIASTAPSDGLSPIEDAQPLTLAALQQLMWRHAGLQRSSGGLLAAREQLIAWTKDATVGHPCGENGDPTEARHRIELRNLWTAARLLVEAALLREESRGAHYRTDFPTSAPEWQKRIALGKHSLQVPQKGAWQ